MISLIIFWINIIHSMYLLDAICLTFTSFMSPFGERIYCTFCHFSCGFMKPKMQEFVLQANLKFYSTSSEDGLIEEEDFIGDSAFWTVFIVGVGAVVFLTYVFLMDFSLIIELVFSLECCSFYLQNAFLFEDYSLAVTF